VKDYLRVVREVDDEVGRVMAYLERENLKDNTIVIYAGDQGFFLGEKGWFDKRWIYEESFRMPLIVHWPEGIEPGSVSEHLVQNLDFAPTVLELAGVEIRDRMQGRSMVPCSEANSPVTGGMRSTIIIMKGRKWSGAGMRLPVITVYAPTVIRLPISRIMMSGSCLIWKPTRSS
jgi:arylsulfatase A-like enzyme